MLGKAVRRCCPDNESVHSGGRQLTQRGDVHDVGHYDVDVGLSGAEGAKPVGEQPLRVDLAREQQLGATGSVPRGTHGAVGLGDGLYGPRQESLTSGGHLHLPGGPHKQRRPHVDLEPFQLSAQDLLGHV